VRTNCPKLSILAVGLRSQGCSCCATRCQSRRRDTVKLATAATPAATLPAAVAFVVLALSNQGRQNGQG